MHCTSYMPQSNLWKGVLLMRADCQRQHDRPALYPVKPYVLPIPGCSSFHYLKKTMPTTCSRSYFGQNNVNSLPAPIRFSRLKHLGQKMAKFTLTVLHHAWNDTRGILGGNRPSDFFSLLNARFSSALFSNRVLTLSQQTSAAFFADSVNNIWLSCVVGYQEIMKVYF